MSYKFKVNESFAKGLRRIAAQQAERASACLETAEDVHKGVHEVRKSIKRLRALLSIYRGGVDAGAARTIDHQLRGLGRSLSGAREIQGMLDSIGKLDERFGIDDKSPALVALRRDLVEQRQADGTNGSIRETAHGLRDALSEAARLIDDLVPVDDDFQAIRGGLEHTYRKARHWHVRAYRAEGMPTPESDEIFHEWRKNLQRHWRHMQLMSPAWPRELKARADLVHAIAETVGGDHDLSVLELHIAKCGRKLGPAAQVRAARRMCRDMQAELRASVRIDGERLFSERASAFCSRLETYWLLAQREQGARHPKKGKTPAKTPAVEAA